MAVTRQKPARPLYWHPNPVGRISPLGSMRGAILLDVLTLPESPIDLVCPTLTLTRQRHGAGYAGEPAGGHGERAPAPYAVSLIPCL